MPDDGSRAPEISSPLASMLARDLHVTYRVYEERRPRMREIMSNGFRRPGFRDIRAVHGLSLTAFQGEVVGVIGHNGSGKSTLLRALAGLLPPSDGEVWARSQPMLLGVNAALQQGLSGRRNIVLGALALGMSRQEISDRVEEIIEFSGLEDFIDLPIKTYSSGMRARLHFSIATSVQPEILLIDEALAVGDEVFKRRSRKRIEELRGAAGTVFLVSHSLGTVRDTCTRVLWLDHGEIRDEGEPPAMVKAYRRHMEREK